MPPPVEPVQVLILGGGVAGAAVLKSLLPALRKAGVPPAAAAVTLVDPKDYFEVPWAVPRALVDAPTRDRLHAAYDGFVGGPRRVGTVTEVSPEAVVLSDGCRLPYDIAVVTTGSAYAGSAVIRPATGPASVRGRRAALDATAAALAAAASVLVIGGGAVGVEVAAEVAAAAAPPPPAAAAAAPARRAARKAITLVHAGDRLVPQLPPRASAAVAARLAALGVTVVLGERVAPRDDDGSPAAIYESTTRPGTTYTADVTVRCTGVTPATDCLRAHFPGALDGRGNVVINAVGAVAGTADRLWAAGDAAITADGASTKNGVWALAAAPVLGRNVAAAVGAAVERRATGLAPAEAPVYKPLRPPPGVMIVTLGPHHGVAKTPLGLSRRLLPWLKNRDMFVAKTRADIGAPPVEAEPPAGGGGGGGGGRGGSGRQGAAAVCGHSGGGGGGRGGKKDGGGGRQGGRRAWWGGGGKDSRGDCGGGKGGWGSGKGGARRRGRGRAGRKAGGGTCGGVDDACRGSGGGARRGGVCGGSDDSVGHSGGARHGGARRRRHPADGRVVGGRWGRARRGAHHPPRRPGRGSCPCCCAGGGRDGGRR
ncbi:hypothetical protein I4F81_002372 [Pyropia yezoensis]|uniref:Uncharacterized protein n=1 Tax=Pyropia yezoensis TaxID=2788 RepID=A0ACC3BPD8_PYRYE|nr:hypothetical protein I4F81_002372 [Neopyropia yezoensis]